MPIITKTVSGTDSELTNHANMLLNMATSLGEAVGETPREIKMATEGISSEVYYYVPMSAIGYNGWCVYFYYYRDVNYNVSIGIRKTIDNVPDLGDNNFVDAWVYRSASLANTFDNKPETCVMIYDESKDTVLFDIHHGTTTHGTDLSSTLNNVNNYIKASLFFARDVNGGVLCGVGNDSIRKLITISGKSTVGLDGEGQFGSSPNESENFSGVLHLTKMVNYLDPSYPEMKSAYVSVIRPNIDTSETKKRVPIYDINGEKWGSVGNVKWGVNSYNFNSYYFPFNPFVNY